MANTLKKQQVSDTVKAIEESGSFVLVEFQNVSHIALEGIRKDLRKHRARVGVVKNTLLHKAVRRLAQTNKELAHFEEDPATFTNKTAVLTFQEGWSDAIGALHKHMKKDAPISFKAAYLDGRYYPAQDMERIAQLPSREQLIAKVIGGIKGPLNAIVYNMQYPMQKMVHVLHEAGKQER